MSRKSGKGMDLIPKWRPINDSFVCMFISPLSLIFTLKLFCFSYMLTRQRGLINMQTKESFIGRHFGIRSIRNETSFAWYCARFPSGMKSSLRCWNRGELEHVNELRVPIGNWGKLAMERELPRYHINTLTTLSSEPLLWLLESPGTRLMIPKEQATKIP